MKQFLSPLPFESQASENGKVSQSWLNWLNELRTFVSPKIFGSMSSPSALIADTALVPSKEVLDQTHFIEGSGGAVDVTANPQIAAGTNVGQKLRLIGTDATNTVKYDDGTGLVLSASYTMGESAVLALYWDGTNWVEEYRNGV